VGVAAHAMKKHGFGRIALRFDMQVGIGERDGEASHRDDIAEASAAYNPLLQPARIVARRSPPEADA